MIFRRYGTFSGGIDLPDHKRPTLSSAIQVAARPHRLIVPLSCGGGTSAEAKVRAGEKVRAGQRIAVARQSDSLDVFAPLDGRVERISAAAVMRWGGFAESPAIELTDLSDPAGIVPPRSADDATKSTGREDSWQSEDDQELLARLADGQIATHRPAPVPLANRIAHARNAPCRWVILNVMDHEPYVSSDHRLLAEYGPEVIEGLAILSKLIGAPQTMVAADRRRTEYYDSCEAAAERFGIPRIALPHKYPMGADAILAKVLTRRETPPGAGPLTIGAAVFDAPTCLAVQQWLVHNRRMLGRVVTVAGPRSAGAGNFWTPFGTPCVDLPALTAGLENPPGEPEAALIHGGPMAGSLCDTSAVVTSATQAMLCLEAEAMPIPGPCVRCGWCTDHCPARLNVAMLNDAFELSLVERAAEGGALACVECGVCSYVCPAKLPLTQRVKQLKRHIVALRKAATDETEGTRAQTATEGSETS